MVAFLYVQKLMTLKDGIVLRTLNGGFMKEKYLMFPLHLQLFAEDDSEANGAEGNKGGQDEGQEPEAKTFTQEEVDNIVKGRIAKEKKAWQKQLDDQRTEAEKLAGMSEKEKKQYQEEKRIKDLDEREAAITRRELTAQAKVQLADKGIPVELADVLNYTDAESCKKSLETVEKAFQSAVEKAVDERLKGGKTLKKAPQNNGITIESINRMSPAEINANWDEIQKVLKENK